MSLQEWERSRACRWAGHGGILYVGVSGEGFSSNIMQLGHLPPDDASLALGPAPGPAWQESTKEMLRDNISFLSHSCFKVLNSCLFICFRGRKTDQIIPWTTPRMPAMAGVCVSPYWELRIWPVSPMWMAGTQLLEPSWVLPPNVHLVRKLESELECRLKPKGSSVGCDCPNRQAKCLPRFHV